MAEIFLETLLESIKLIPFLFLAYLLIEYVEHKQSDKLEAALLGAGKFGVFGGSLLGSFPQCGFSVAASNFYAGRVISIGTLISVFVATSDEALPILLSRPERFTSTLLLLTTKIVFAIIAGILAELIFARKNRRASGEEIHEEMCSHCKCESHGIWYATARHTLTIFLFIFVVSFLFHWLIHELGTETLSAAFQSTAAIHPLIAVFIGLIPNCASSVILTELYLAGTLSFGATIAGLCAGSGLGLLVLFRVNKRVKENLSVLVFVLIFSTLTGYLLQFLGL